MNLELRCLSRQCCRIRHRRWSRQASPKTWKAQVGENLGMGEKVPAASRPLALELLKSALVIRYRSRFPLVLLLALAAREAAAGDWVRFRGPNGSGVAESKRVPVEFAPDKNVVWKTPLPPGHSSPVLSAFVVGSRKLNKWSTVVRERSPMITFGGAARSAEGKEG